MRGHYAQYVGQETAVPDPYRVIPDPVAEAKKRRWESDAIQFVKNAHRRQRAPFYGYYFSGIQGRQEVHPFTTLEDAFAWFESVGEARYSRQKLGQLADYDYMAIFNPADMRQALWEEFPHFWDPRPSAGDGKSVEEFFGELFGTVSGWPHVGQVPTQPTIDPNVLRAVGDLDVLFRSTYSDVGHQAGFIPVQGSAQRVEQVRRTHPSFVASWQFMEAAFEVWSEAKRLLIEGTSILSLAPWDLLREMTRGLNALRQHARAIGMTLTGPDASLERSVRVLSEAPSSVGLWPWR